jgi:hypothetical protein
MPPKGDFKFVSAGTHLLGQVQKHITGRHSRVLFYNQLRHHNKVVFFVWRISEYEFILAS